MSDPDATDCDNRRKITQKPPISDGLDSTLSLLREGYLFITRHCDRLGTDVFQTRLLFQKTICMRGREAAEIFYDQGRFARAGACPGRVRKTLFGEGGVQGLDGAEHRHRKAMFMSLMTAREIDRLVELTISQWRAYEHKWAGMEEVVLFDEVTELLCRSVCGWAGVPLGESEVGQRSREMKAMIAGAGAVASGYVKGRLARKSAEQWAADLVRRVRSGALEISDQSALSHIAWHRNLQGELLSGHEAAVELLNVLRPTVAVARYIVFSALALHDYSDCRKKLGSSDLDYAGMFVQEVRRFYPFFPFVAARACKAFTWNGFRFPQGVRVLLDLYGTNHDAALWGDPGVFRPERFRQREEDAFDLIPQGGGDHYHNHRCAGEWITVALMRAITDRLANSMDYVVPEQDLSIDLTRIPALPESRFIISHVRPGHT